MLRFSRCLLAAWAVSCLPAQAQIGVDLSNATGSGTSQDKFQINNLRVTPGNAGYNVLFRFDPGSLHLIPESIAALGSEPDCATAAVTVTHAATGASIPGATVAIGSAWAVTNSVGVATLSHLPAGNVTVMGNAGTFVPGMKPATLSCGAASNPLAIALTPMSGAMHGLASGQFRVVLSWNNPAGYSSILHASLTGPVAQSNARWNVWGPANSTDGGVCALGSQESPSTITCLGAGGGASPLPDGLYRFAVHQSVSVGSTIASMGASVRLEFADGTSHTFGAPALGFAGAKDAWTVFELTVSGARMSVVPIHSLTRTDFVGYLQ